MQCPHCLANLPDDSLYCTECGVNIKEFGVADGMIRCMNCSKPTPKDSNFCTNCRAPLTQIAMLQVKKQIELSKQEAQIKMQAVSLKMQNEQLRIQNEQFNSMLRCPKCGSTSISGNKKGYGVVKGGIGAAALGAITGGPVGMVIGLGAGNIGRKKVVCTCMNCGYRFKAGKER